MNFVFAYQVSVFLKDAFEIFHNFSQIALAFCNKCTIAEVAAIILLNLTAWIMNIKQ